MIPFPLVPNSETQVASTKNNGLGVAKQREQLSNSINIVADQTKTEGKHHLDAI